MFCRSVVTIVYLCQIWESTVKGEIKNRKIKSAGVTVSHHLLLRDNIDVQLLHSLFLVWNAETEFKNKFILKKNANYHLVNPRKC